MNWCLSWWTPSGASEVLIAIAFWTGLAATGFWAWTRHRAARVSALTTATGGDRQQAGTTEDEAPHPGARSGSTR
jgi:hypothetical protein